MRITKLLLLLFLFSACSNNGETSKPDITFERTKWDAKDGSAYLYRVQMINDLIKNYRWPGVKKDSVVKLLGEPDEIEEDTFLLYHYKQKYLGTLPMFSESLIFELTADSTVKLVR